MARPLVDNTELQGMPALSSMQYLQNDFNNSGISINYVKEWGFAQALRELIQNAVDGMTSYLNAHGASKADWKVTFIDKSHDGTEYRNYLFTWPLAPGGEMVLGKMTYDPDSEQLILENPGSINKFNLLLGGSGGSKQQDNPDIIGRFGEGMKLAALAFLRPTQGPPYTDEMLVDNGGRSLVIDTNKERWLFKLQRDRNFDGHICLFYKITKMKDNKFARLGYQEQWTYTRINGLSLGEWTENRIKFLFFCKQDESYEIATREGCAHKGSLLLDESMKGRFYVKQLHIKQYQTCHYDCKSQSQTHANFKQQDDPAGSFYGYDTNAITLNRDRMSIPNLWHRYERCSAILANVLNNFHANLGTYQECVDELGEMWSVVYWLLRFNKFETYYFGGFANGRTCDRIWGQWTKDRLEFPSNENHDSSIQPMYNGVEVSRFLHKHNLADDFYRHVYVSNQLWGVLTKSSHYEKWTSRFSKSQLNDSETATKDRLVRNIQKVKSTFTKEMVCFKDNPLTVDSSFAQNGKLYLGKELLANEANLLAKSLMLLKIPTSKILQCYNVIN